MEALSAQPLRDLDSVVSSVEEACAVGRALSEKERGRLEHLAVDRPAFGVVHEELASLRSFGHRLWTALATEGAAALAGAQEAQLRQLACELYAAGSSRYEPCLDERAMAAAQWALAGRAWAMVDADEEAAKCFDAASQPWARAAVPGGGGAENDAAKLAEAACQAQLWLGTSHFRRGAAEEAFQALSTARDAMGSSKDVEDIMLDDLLRACYEQAHAHRGAGNPRPAVELLTLAVAALPSTTALRDANGPGAAPDAPLSSRLMRQLALCYAELQDREAALLHARQAVAVAPFLEGQHRSLSLQVLLRILCRYPFADATQTGAEEEEVQRVAMSLMSQHEAKVEDCLAACDLLLQQHKGREAVVDACLRALGARVQGDAGARCELLLFKLRLAAKRVEASLQSDAQAAAAARKRLDEVVAEAEALKGEAAGRPERASKAVAGALYDLGNAACDAGRNDLAVDWLQRAVPFVASATEAASCWVTAAVCLRRLGRAEEARDFAGRALALDPSHLHAALLLLVSLAERGKDSRDATEELHGLLERVHAHPAFGLEHAAMVAQALLQHPDGGLALAGLEALARRMVRGADEDGEESMGKNGLDGLKVAHELLAKGEALGRPEGELLRHLALASELLAARRAQVALELREGGGAGADDLRGIVNAVWSRGQALGRGGRWSACAAVFEALQKLLEQLDSVDLCEVLEPRAWCLTMIASARVQCVKELAGRPQERGELCQQALQCLDRAHQLCRRASRPAQTAGAGGIGAEAAAGSALSGMPPGSSTLSRIFMVLVLLEFEVRCLEGDSEAQLRHFVDASSSQEAVGVKSLLAMSKIAGATLSRRLAIHCLQRYLRVFIGARGVVDFSQCAAAYREMIVLHASRNESFSVYEGILHLLSGDGGGGGVSAVAAAAEVVGGCSAPSSYPQEEIAWLVATAWNNGAHFYRLQQYRWGERWMGKSLALARFCPPGSFPEDQMSGSYNECRKFCGD